MKLIEIKEQEIGTQTVNSVNARELFETLEIKKDFSSWFKQQIDTLGLEENMDYIVFTLKGENSQLKGGRPLKEYIITTDTAKHISMSSRTEKGKEARNYFIQVEKVALNAIAQNNQLTKMDIAPVVALFEKQEQMHKLHIQEIKNQIQNTSINLEIVQSEVQNMANTLKTTKSVSEQTKSSVIRLHDTIEKLNYQNQMIADMTKEDLSKEQIERLTAAKHEKAHSIGDYKKDDIAKAYKQIDKMIKFMFGAKAIHQIKSEDFTKALNMINNIKE